MEGGREGLEILQRAKVVIWIRHTSVSPRNPRCSSLGRSSPPATTHLILASGYGLCLALGVDFDELGIEAALAVYRYCLQRQYPTWKATMSTTAKRPSMLEREVRNMSEMGDL